MTLFLDSASAEDGRAAAALAFVWGATTNPHLVARSGLRADEAVPLLCDVLPGLVFHQVVGETVGDRESDARRMLARRPGRIGLKIPCTLENLSMAARLASEGHVVGLTAVFSPAQVHLACEAGARYVLPYVNRSTRLLGDGASLVRAMRGVVDAHGAGVEIIAASLKTPDEAVETLLAGAHHLTVPLAVIAAMAAHPLSEQAIADFGSPR